MAIQHDSWADAMQTFGPWWKMVGSSCRAYQVRVAAVRLGDAWFPYVMVIDGVFEADRQGVAEVASSPGLYSVFRGFISPAEFEASVINPADPDRLDLPGSVSMRLPSPVQGASERYNDKYRISGETVEEAFKYSTVQASYNLQALQQFVIDGAAIAAGYNNFEDVLQRELDLRHERQSFRIVLPIGIRVSARLQDKQVSCQVECREPLRTVGLSVRVGSSRSGARPLEDIQVATTDDGWDTLSGRLADVAGDRTSVWISHDQLPAEAPSPGERAQYFRLDVALTKVPEQTGIAGEDSLLALIYSRDDHVPNLPRAHGALTNAQTSDKGSFEAAVANWLTYAGARIYWTGDGVGKTGVDLVALSPPVPPYRALVVSVTMSNALNEKVRTLLQVLTAYRVALAGREVLPVVATPVRYDAVSLSALVDLVGGGIALCAHEELEWLSESPRTYGELWSTLSARVKSLQDDIVASLGIRYRSGFGFLGEDV